ncbi:MAG: hypothetical protein ACLR0F_10840 [Eisenbergiella sp.]
MGKEESNRRAPVLYNGHIRKNGCGRFSLGEEILSAATAGEGGFVFPWEWQKGKSSI